MERMEWKEDEGGGREEEEGRKEEGGRKEEVDDGANYYCNCILDQTLYFLWLFVPSILPPPPHLLPSLSHIHSAWPLPTRLHSHLHTLLYSLVHT